MKKLLCLVLLTGCTVQQEPAPLVTNIYQNAITDRQKLVQEFKTAEVFVLPDDGYQFVVRDTNGSVWFIHSGRANANQSGKTMIFGPSVPKAIVIEDPEPSVLSTNK